MFMSSEQLNAALAKLPVETLENIQAAIARELQLREQGQRELTTFAQVKEAEAAKPGLHSYTPEMGEAKPVAEIEARIGHYGNWYLTTDLQLQGRGIKRVGISAKGLNIYTATEKAFEKLEKHYSISHESRLD